MNSLILRVCLAAVLSTGAGCTIAKKSAADSKIDSTSIGLIEGSEQWATIANSAEYSDAERRHAVFTLFKRYTKPGMTLHGLRRLLGEPTWLTSSDIIEVVVVAGYIPIESNFDDTVFALLALPRSEHHKSAIYFRVSGRVSRTVIEKCLLRGESEDCHQIIIEAWGFAEQKN